MSEQRDSQRVRVALPKATARMAFGNAFAELFEAFPKLELELELNDAFVDIQARGLDAGVRNGEVVQDGMVPVPITHAIRSVVVGSPAYLERRGRPTEPKDLRSHACLGYRWPQTGAIYPWPLTNGRQSLEHLPHGPLVTDDNDVLIEAAVDGAGLMWTIEPTVRAHLESGALVEVLSEWSQTFPPFYLYYDRAEGMSAGLRQVVEFLRKRLEA